jgi:predicted nuclease with RNAse H fold
MSMFLGYDPGGHGKHGVSAVKIGPEGEFISEPELDRLATVKDVCSWLGSHQTVAAAGIDTLVAWSPLGYRACDVALRKYYSDNAISVIPQNSLYSAMTLNGMIFALTCQQLNIPIIETHPRLLVRGPLSSIIEGTPIVQRYKAEKNDDLADALVASWAASRWYFRKWDIDLFVECSDDLVFPAGRAVYPWPESIEDNTEDAEI